MADIRELIGTLAERFDRAGLFFGHGTDNAWDEATALVLAVTGQPDHVDSLDIAVASEAAARIETLAQRRIAERIPLAYLLGEWTFAGFSFEVSPDVIVPRSPVAQLLLEACKPWLGRAPRRVLDLCCGSGCLGIIAAKIFPECEVVLADIAPASVRLSGINVARHGLQGRVQVCQGDLFDAVPNVQFDLIVCNPPYVDAPDMQARPEEYRHEPELALDGGASGIDCMAKVLTHARDYLADDGWMIGEVGASSAALSRAYPKLPFIWPALGAGGEGVFLLEAQTLDSHTARSRSPRD